MRGSSQQVSTRRGVERGSVAMYRLSSDQPVSDMFWSQDRLISAIIRLCVRAVGHSHLAGASQVVGTSMSVGIRIFSTVVSSGFVIGRFRVSGRWLLVVLGPRLPHRLRRLAGV